MPANDEFWSLVVALAVCAFLAHAILRPEAGAEAAPTAPTDIRRKGKEARAYTTRLVLVMVGFGLIVLYTEAFMVPEPTNGRLPAFMLHVGILTVLTTLSIGYFLWVIAYVLYLSVKDETFDADAMRLARDTLVSTLFLLTAAALLFQAIGLDKAPEGPGDYLYFAAVTFSTLGYGDFSPSHHARPIAAILAMFGNVHLAILVGAALVALKSSNDANGAAP